MKETYDDLAILEYYEYRCVYCLDLLPVWGHVKLRRVYNGVRFAPGHRFAGVFGWDASCGRVYFGFAWDHVIPHSRGGESSWDNFVPACTLCNSAKGNKTPIEWLLKAGGFKPLRTTHKPYAMVNPLYAMDHNRWALHINRNEKRRQWEEARAMKIKAILEDTEEAEDLCIE